MTISKRKPLCIIPARGGSKRIPRKNIKLFAGKPLLSWSIQCAKQSQLFDSIYVSSEDSEVLSIASQFGGDCLERDPDYAKDQDHLIKLLVHLIPQLNSHNQFTDLILLVPTSPFRKPETIKQAWDYYLEKDASALLSIQETSYPPQWTLALRHDCIEPLFSEFQGIPKNKLEHAFLHDGCVLIINIEKLFEYKTWYPPKTIGFKVSKIESIDLDYPEDWEYAEWLQHRHNILNTDSR